MSPVRAAPGMSEQTIQKFYGQVSDRAGEISKKPKQFDSLINVSSDLSRLQKRKGTAKYQSVTHATGSKVYGLYEVTGIIDTDFTMAKQSSGVMYFYSSLLGGWRNHTENVSFPTSRSYFVEMNGENTYDATINISDTATGASTTTSVTLTTNTSQVVNALVGAILTVDYGSGRVEKKVVLANTASVLTLSADDPLDAAPPNTTTITIKSAGNNMYVAGGGQYAKFNPGRCIATISTTTMTDGYDRLDNVGVNSYASTGIEEFGGRVLSWSGNRVRYSDLNNGDNFSKNAYMDIPGSVFLCKRYTDDICIIYERTRTYALVGTDPATWKLKLIMENEGTNRPEMVNNYTSIGNTMQIFMNNNNQIKAITPEVLNARDREVKSLTLSKNYVQESLSASANYLCAGITLDGIYVIARSDDTYLCLNMEASERTDFKEWIWHSEARPAAQLPYVLTLLNGFLNGGADDNGQVYTFYSGNDDDGTAIAMTITRRGLQFEQFGDDTKWYSMNLATGPSGTTTTVTVNTEVNNTPTGAINNLLGTYDPSTGNKFRRFRIKNNPSLAEGTGKHIDYTITESSSVAVAPIEMIQFTYFAGIIR